MPVEEEQPPLPPVGAVDMAHLLSDPPKPPMSCPEGTSLWLFGRNLDDANCEVLAKALRRGDYRHITYLTLGHNAITGRGVSAIAGAIAQDALPSLTSLGLMENAIGPDGMVALSAVLHKMPDIQSLELYECGIGADGMQALVDAAKGGALQSLSGAYLRGNAIGDAGMIALCDAFAAGALPKCQMLQLSQNEVGDEGCLKLADTIEAGQLGVMRQIQMGQNKQSRDGFEVVTDVIKEYELNKGPHRFDVIF